MFERFLPHCDDTYAQAIYNSWVTGELGREYDIEHQLTEETTEDKTFRDLNVTKSKDGLSNTISSSSSTNYDSDSSSKYDEESSTLSLSTTASPTTGRMIYQSTERDLPNIKNKDTNLGRLAVLRRGVRTWVAPKVVK